jgi:hypothetical protein
MIRIFVADLLYCHSISGMSYGINVFFLVIHGQVNSGSLRSNLIILHNIFSYEPIVVYHSIPSTLHLQNNTHLEQLNDYNLDVLYQGCSMNKSR